MVKTENRIDLLTETFHKTLELNKTYLRTDLEEIMRREMDYYYNVTALTYNRWNRGMTFVCPLFEHVDRGVYRYLGPNYPYNGILSHFPQGQYEEYILGRWVDGVPKFSNENIKSFKDWISSDYEGERIVSIGSKVIVEYNGEKEFKFFLSEEGGMGSTDGFGHISHTSMVGKNIKGMGVGHEFEMAGGSYKIVSIK